MKKGSITVFLALTSVLVLSFVFSLLEGARVYCLKGKAQSLTDICMQSMFGNYHAGLWKDYHLLFLDGSWQEETFSINKFVQRAMTANQQNLRFPDSCLWDRNWDITRLESENISISGYELATDDAGKVFRSQVAVQMQQEIVSDAIKELTQIREQGNDLKQRTAQKEEQWSQAWEALEQAEEEALEQAEEEALEQAEEEALEQAKEEEVLENPMDYVKELKRSSVLSLVTEEPSQISGKALDQGNLTLMERQLQEGNWKQDSASELSDRLLLQYYIQNYFSSYTTDSEKGAGETALSYEIEYLIGGNKSDSENLERVVYQLLGIREALNFATIMQDSEKKGLAFSIATAAVGFTGLAPLIKAVQIGVLLAWAFVESVMDIRTLLKGGKIPFLKRTDQWSSDLTACRNAIESDSKATEDEKGLSYTQYLQLLSFLLGDKTINYRCMDIIEQNEQVQMDHMVQSVEGTFSYEAKPLFWSLNFLTGKGWSLFHITTPGRMSYGI